MSNPKFPSCHLQLLFLVFHCYQKRLDSISYSLTCGYRLQLHFPLASTFHRLSPALSVSDPYRSSALSLFVALLWILSSFSSTLLNQVLTLDSISKCSLTSTEGGGVDKGFPPHHVPPCSCPGRSDDGIQLSRQFALSAMRAHGCWHCLPRPKAGLSFSAGLWHRRPSQTVPILEVIPLQFMTFLSS